MQCEKRVSLEVDLKGCSALCITLEIGLERR